MGMPVLLAVDSGLDALERVERELKGRYSVDYRVIAEGSAAAARETLRRLREDGEQVALVLCDQWLPGGTTGAELLDEARSLHPGAKRGLLIEWGAWGDRETAEAIFDAMAMGRIDYYVLKPQTAPDELFHRTVGEFLFEWARSESPLQGEIEIVAAPGAQRSHELHDLLARNGVPYVCHPPDSAAGRALLDEAGVEGSTVPVARVRPGTLLVDPSNVELASAFGVSTEVEERSYDVVVVGAGPAGLAAAVYASSEGLRALVVERESIGGQAGSSSLIRNYLGFSRGVSGSDLAQRAYQQAWVFGTSFLIMREVVELRPGDPVHSLRISDGTEIEAKAVVLASGVSYRRPDVPGLTELEGAGVFYGAATAEAKALSGKRVFVVGGGNSAGQAAMHLSRFAERVTVVVRGPSLAASMSSYLRGEIESAANVEVALRTEVAAASGAGRLEVLTLRSAGGLSTVAADGLFVMIGARPGTDWLPPEIERDDWGYVLTGRDLPGRATVPMGETSVPRVYAVGDVRHGSVKRVASAVGEGSVVIQQVYDSIV
jgi:thioredoxin reductase (NADPH)